ncbi:MAG: hypothetical protein AAGA50_02435 [Pseudomonadota bacterium]
MSKASEPLSQLEGFEGLWTVQRGNLRCTAIRLATGGVCLYSPVEKLSSEFARLAPVRFLFAPNHYHNKAIPEYADAFPDARLISGAEAGPRLEKITSCKFEGLEGLKAGLPEHVSLVQPDGLKTGEIWLRVEGSAGIAWVVTDAFCGLKAVKQEEAALGFLKTFPKYGIQNADRFASWVRDRAEEDAPMLVLPCHGSVVSGPNLKSDILALLDRL